MSNMECNSVMAEYDCDRLTKKGKYGTLLAYLVQANIWIFSLIRKKSSLVFHTIHLAACS